MIFGMWNPQKISREILEICPPRLSDVATLPWEIHQQYYSYIILIIYVISEENKL